MHTTGTSTSPNRTCRAGRQHAPVNRDGREKPAGSDPCRPGRPDNSACRWRDRQLSFAGTNISFARTNRECVLIDSQIADDLASAAGPARRADGPPIADQESLRDLLPSNSTSPSCPAAPHRWCCFSTSSRRSTSPDDLLDRAVDELEVRRSSRRPTLRRRTCDVAASRRNVHAAAVPTRLSARATRQSSSSPAARRAAGRISPMGIDMPQAPAPADAAACRRRPTAPNPPPDDSVAR